jgi:chemotaxis protein CheZ
VQRKIFRVEQMFSDRRLAMPREGGAGPRQAADGVNALRLLAERREETIDATVTGLERELALVREAIHANTQDLNALIGERKERRMARAAGELGAAVDAMEKATQKILHATEGIDDSAKTLNAALSNDYQRGLAQDIQEHAVKIYEACNFQDLAGQRIAKVVDMLSLLETQLTAMIARCNGSSGVGDASLAVKLVHKRGQDERGLVNGPRLDGEAGHVGQRDIDAMFS